MSCGLVKRFVRSFVSSWLYLYIRFGLRSFVSSWLYLYIRFGSNLNQLIVAIKMGKKYVPLL